MPAGNATEQPRSSFRGCSPKLAAAQPSNQASGEISVDPGSGDGCGAAKVLSALDEMIRREFG